ncbi:putative Outer membrane protein, OmpA/MotB [Vibrio nigripulchritudo MADA3029]|uniref:OmpA family protein n=1 Tax=Vibrio nigripulchritudo TaxID=28173 RepID=UPI00021C30BB|nr:OmpA family protein [Vibrio nigripulchritudo]EGU61497.1 putative outer membrane protein [Vibrio nigripulchritudo ATCC 27043]CCN49288.1 putative Outer membrane protein, OmpA/MotB [Vibrio nigripulchritudo MADA3020]CCN54273.1 putative Outer membrane protein, OmpA/MotB [Vibrio nigripulchritudo MADA3021]CCN61343.1 putative Outer membrane protein, OmpA/MotB [Vibrio nigripulchritudo MADA3029]
MKYISTLLATVVILSGCQATQRQNATTGQNETNSATKGVILGALAGAAAGAITGDDSKDRQRRALYGALGGAAVGGGIGYYFDKQEEELRTSLVNSGVQVERLDDNQLLLVMENGIGFHSGSYALDPSIHQTLNNVAKVFNRYPDTKLVVNGHTDSSGNDSRNQVLSEQRATQVQSYLIGQNIQPGRVDAKGFGERYPVCDNATTQGRACNRRVEIQILPL